ncbi:MAG: ribosome small subunit-dependent GTPase A [Bulleidia sp.]
MKAKIIKILSKDYTVILCDGRVVPAVAMGKLRRGQSPVIGDEVEVEERSGRFGIQRIYPRRNQLYRPRCANVDQALIVMSVKDPDFSTTLVDRLCMLIVHAGIEPLLCVTKCDLGIPEATERAIRVYERGPMRVVRNGRKALNPAFSGLFQNKITVLTGQSGAGKSSLLNELDPTFHLATQTISKALGRGKHTTRHSQLHPVCGGLVADTPGFSSLNFSHIKKEELAASVLAFRPYLGKCRFNDCLHYKEPGCAVKKAVEEKKIDAQRYAHYTEILEQLLQRKENYG